mgnify:CR=1 FL=1
MADIDFHFHQVAGEICVPRDENGLGNAQIVDGEIKQRCQFLVAVLGEFEAVVDLLFDPNGAVEAAVVEFGGFLGIGSRKIAIEWSALRFQSAANKLVAILDIPSDQLRSAPDYKPGQPAAIMTGDRPTE